MTREEKRELLIKDLSARLPYGVKVDVNFYDATKELTCDLLRGLFLSEKQLRPYLRRLSSMTKEEEEEYDTLIYLVGFGANPIRASKRLLDFCNKHYLDYNDLIPNGLALEASEGMYDAY